MIIGQLIIILYNQKACFALVVDEAKAVRQILQIDLLGLAA